MVNGYTGVYDGAAHGATGTATGVLNEPLAGLDLGASFTNVPGGTATWTFTDGTGNYNDAERHGRHRHQQGRRDHRGEWLQRCLRWCGARRHRHGQGRVERVPLAAALDLGMSFTNVPGGTATWNFAGNTNYKSASGSVAIVINKRTLTITPDGGKTKILGEVFTAFTGTVPAFRAMTPAPPRMPVSGPPRVQPSAATTSPSRSPLRVELDRTTTCS